MADILIRGMEMPKGCGGCPCSIYGACDAVKGRKSMPAEYRWSANKRPTWCPLIALPEGHGDLIDRNALYEKTAEWEATALHMVEKTINDEDTAKWKRWSAILTERSAFKFDVADAPTIVPAEKEDV